MKRLIVIVAALAVALLLQLTFVNGLPLPGGGAPDLVLLCVIAIGLTGGTEAGIVAGFFAGLALDLAPPANELIGQYALVFCLIGYGCGRLRFTLLRSAVLAFGTAAIAAVAGELLSACLVLVLDTPQVTLATVVQVLPSTVLYDLLLGPLLLFAAVRLAIGLGVSFNPLDDSPALEPGGSAAQVGLAGLGLRRAPNAGLGVATSDGVATGSGSWLTGDSVAAAAAVGSVGWLRGPARSRRQRREQSRLTAALTGAAPRPGAVWVGNRPPGLQHVTQSVAAPSGLHRLRPDSGVGGSATREGLPAPALPSREPRIDFAGDSSSGSGAGAVPRKTPKIAFGTGSLPGSGRTRGRRSARINFSRGGQARTGTAGGAGGSSKASGGMPGRAFGTGSVPGSSRVISPRGRSPRIAFNSGLPRVPRTSTGRSARPRFGSRSGRSASGSWLAGSRFRSGGIGQGGRGLASPAKGASLGGTSSGYGLRRSHWPRTAKMRRRRRWLWWLR